METYEDDGVTENLSQRQRIYVEAIASGKTKDEARQIAGFAEGYKVDEKPQVQRAIFQRVRHAQKMDVEEAQEIISLQARGDIGDLHEFFTSDGGFDLKRAKEAGLSRIIKRINIKRTPIVHMGEIVGTSVQTTIEKHDSFAAAAKLLDHLTRNQGEVKDRAETVRQQLERLVSEGWSQEDAKAILVEAHPDAEQYIN